MQYDKSVYGLSSAGINGNAEQRALFWGNRLSEFERRRSECTIYIRSYSNAKLESRNVYLHRDKR